MEAILNKQLINSCLGENHYFFKVFFIFDQRLFTLLRTSVLLCLTRQLTHCFVIVYYIKNCLLPLTLSLIKNLFFLTGLVDEQQKVRTITALASAALAEAATPYGIESFDSVLKPLWKGIRTHRGKGLAAFLKAIGYLIPLMDAEYANYYTREVMLILIREFQSPDEEMKKIVLKVFYLIHWFFFAQLSLVSTPTITAFIESIYCVLFVI